MVVSLFEAQTLIQQARERGTATNEVLGITVTFTDDDRVFVDVPNGTDPDDVMTSTLGELCRTKKNMRMFIYSDFEPISETHVRDIFVLTREGQAEKTS